MRVSRCWNLIIEGGTDFIGVEDLPNLRGLNGATLFCSRDLRDGTQATDLHDVEGGLHIKTNKKMATMYLRYGPLFVFITAAILAIILILKF